MKYRKAIIWIMMAFSFLLFLRLWTSSPYGIEGGQDSYLHYLIARFSWQHSHLFLDQWGKPVFTLLTSAVCQTSINGLIFFNIICTLFSGFFAFKAAKEMKIKVPEIAFVLVIFAPVVFGKTISGLTEPLNALLVSFMLYQFAKERYRTAYSIASFLPFVRTEGFVIIGVVFLFLLLKGHYKYLPYFLFGTLFYSIIGAIISGNVLWVIDENPYVKFEREGEVILGTGSFMHYINAAKRIWTFPLLIFGTITFLWTIYLWVTNKDSKRPMFLAVLGFGVFFMYLMAHSTIFYLGILGAQGLVRVMVVAVPCLAVLSAFGMERLVGVIKSINLKFLFYAGVSFFMFFSAYSANEYVLPWQAGRSVQEENVSSTLREALAYIKENNLNDKLLIHQLPIANAFTNYDPYSDPSLETTKTAYLWSLDLDGEWMREDQLVLWDGYHAGREGNMPLDKISAHPKYKLIKKFVKKNQGSDYNGHFDLYLFQRTK